MGPLRYISVILPLKLDWEPVYATDDPSVETGGRVAVRFAGARYTGVVSGFVTPDIAPERIQPILCPEKGLERIAETEIALWRAVAGYYLCTVGEVYKAAYPSLKTEKEESLARQKARLLERLDKRRKQWEKARKEETRQRYEAEIRLLESAVADPSASGISLPDIPLSPDGENAWQEVQKAFSAGKVALLQAPDRSEVFLKAAAETLRQRKNVLYLVPGIALNRQLEERLAARFGSLLKTYHSALPAARKRAVAETLRSGGNCLVLGTRSALFLPLRRPGLILVDQEQDISYKQDAPAPRYNGRDTAILLGAILHCPVLLGSATPSFEALYNARTGRFHRIVLPAATEAEVRLIDTQAERRKRGMDGVLSRKALEQLRETLDGGRQAAVILPRHARDTDTAQLEEGFRERFPGLETVRIEADLPEGEMKSLLRRFAGGASRLLICTQDAVRFMDFEGPSCIVVLQAERLAPLQDFRSDERTLQWLESWRIRAGSTAQPGRLIIQTAQPDHPVFRILQGFEVPEGKLLDERRQWGYPPFTRLIDIQIRDNNPSRLDRLSRELVSALPAGLALTGPYAPAGTGAEGGLRLIRIALERTRELAAQKDAIARAVHRFGKERNYIRHIALDVDPA